MTFGEGLYQLTLGPWRLLTDALRTLFSQGVGVGILFALVVLLVLAGPILCRIKDSRRGERKEKPLKNRKATGKWDRWLYPLCCGYLILLTGLMIPSSIISASPAEFVDTWAYRNPGRYLISSALLAAGTFGLWAGAYYLLLNERGRKGASLALSVCTVWAAINYMLFGTGYGNLSPMLRYDVSISNPAGTVALNLVCLIAAGAGVILLWKKWPLVLRFVCIYGCVSMAVMSGMNIASLENAAGEVEKITTEAAGKQASFSLDREGRNVVVIMLDRAIGGFVPFLMNEKPEMKEQFDGFTWYPNTLSYGYHTNIAAPALFGGYEYTPDGLTARADLSLREKHNEALKIMPLNFLEAEYEVTVCDAPYANYQWISDMSIYDGTPEIRTYNTIGMFDDSRDLTMEYQDHVRNRNLFCYSLFRASPLLLQPMLYNEGRYLEPDAEMNEREGNPLYGVSPDFLKSYYVLTNLSQLTRVTEEGKNTFLMLTNETTHNVIELQEPEYVPARQVDNSAWEGEHGIRRAEDGRTLDLTEASELMRTHYQSDMAAFLQLGKWFDAMREAGVYDNTRIILVSDHSCYLGLSGINLAEKYDSLPDVPAYEKAQWTDTTCYNPLLMVKDFNSTGFTVDNTFMTNADTPFLAFERLIESPTNPFTGRPLSQAEKETGEYHLVESDWRIENNHGNVFTNPIHITFRGQDIFDPDGWTVEGSP